MERKRVKISYAVAVLGKMLMIFFPFHEGETEDRG